METLMPRALISRPIDAVAIPLPTDETTPPVTKIYLVIASPFSNLITPAGWMLYVVYSLISNFHPDEGRIRFPACHTAQKGKRIPRSSE
jgi:hypothetical protein